MANRYAVSLVLVVASLAAFVPTGAIATDEYVMSRIECPQTTNVKLNWSNKIGADPAFTIGDEGQQLGVPFKASSIAGQMITCRYESATNPGLKAQYQYDVKRQILGCTGTGQRVLQCKLKK